MLACAIVAIGLLLLQQGEVSRRQAHAVGGRRLQSADLPDRYAPMRALYESTGGPSWSNADGWMGDDAEPCSSWYGVV
jgi:hypothetical protein